MGRKIPTWQVLMVLLFTILTFCYALGIFGKISPALACGYGELHIPLVITTIFAVIVAVANGYKWSFLEAGMCASIDRAMPSILILITVGMLIGVWIAGGVVPAMIYYGLMILRPGYFLVACAVLALIVALATGSSWTTAGTIGVALVGVGVALGINPAMTAGAIVSGAYCGDKMSPLSDTTNLAPAMAGSNIVDHIRKMMWTVIPSFGIALVVFAVLGMGHGGENMDMTLITTLQEGLKENFKINPLLLLPVLVVICIVALKLPALPGLYGGIALGVIACFFQGADSTAVFTYLHYGFWFDNPDAVDPYLVDLLTRGGMDGMMWTISMGLAALAFGGVMDASGMLQTVSEMLLKFAKGTGSLVTVAVLTCILVNIVAADQYLAILLPGRMYKEAFEDARLHPSCLSRVLEDAGTVTSPIVPWTTCAVTMTSFLGVTAFQYIPFAVMNYVNPLVSIFYGFTGISMTKMSDEEYEACLKRREAEKEKLLGA